MSSATPRVSGPVPINGPALRVIRQLHGVEIADVAALLECTPSYISKLETGANKRCRGRFLTDLCAALGHVDRRALLAVNDDSDLVDGRPRGSALADVHINGIALRTLRVAYSLDRKTFAAIVELTPDALALLEARQAAACSPGVVARAAIALGVPDRRALLANPYGDHRSVDRWAAAVEDPTAPMPRPATDPTGPPIAVAPRRGRHRREVSA